MVFVYRGACGLIAHDSRVDGVNGAGVWLGGGINHIASIRRDKQTLARGQRYHQKLANACRGDGANGRGKSDLA
ncbi:hypothetical protein [Moraxella lacunata]|uniref:hypothetical protein n=1 Tax=Moraxella lacunata TaxID=477 RepID=UPI003EE2CE08